MLDDVPKWVQQQEKTMIRWINSKLLLSESNPDLPFISIKYKITNLNLDLKSGLILIQITNQIISEINGNYFITPIYSNPKFEIQFLQNLIDYLKFVDLILNLNTSNLISGQDFINNNYKLILGFIWSLFLFSINSINSSFIIIKQILLNWLNILSPNFKFINFNTNWSIKLNNINLINLFNNIFNYYSLQSDFKNIIDILSYLHNQLHLPHLIDYDDFNTDSPDEKCIIPFVIELFKYFELFDDIDDIDDDIDEDLHPSIQSSNDFSEEIESHPDLSTLSIQSSDEFSDLLKTISNDSNHISSPPTDYSQSDRLISSSNNHSQSELSNSSKSTIIVETYDELISLILSTYNLKQNYESNASNIVEKITESIFQLTNLLVVENSSSKFDSLIASLDCENIESLQQSLHTFLLQLDELNELLGKYENYILRVKPQLFYHDYSTLSDQFSHINLNLNQLHLKYIPESLNLNFETIRQKISTLIDSDYEIVDHLKPFIENLQTIDLNIVFQVLEAATVEYKDDLSKKDIVVSCLDDFDVLYSMIDKLDTYYELFLIQIQPENIEQLDDQILRIEIPNETKVNLEVYQRFKLSLAKNTNKLTKLELNQLLKSLNLKEVTINNFIEIIPSENCISSSDSDFELTSSSASTNSITSHDDKLFDKTQPSSSTSKVYDVTRLFQMIENGFSI